MPLYRYKAMGKGGKEEGGVIDADSLSMAKERLRRDKVWVTSITELSRKKIILPPALLLSFTRELAQLLHAGLPLYESLLTVEEKQRKTPYHPLFADLCDHLKGGKSPSQAFSYYPETFSEIYLSMVRSAEQSGALSKVFEQLAFLIGKQQKMRKQLVAALAYPAFLGGFCFLVTGALFFFVIPSMRELFEGRALHPVTLAVLTLSDGLREHGWLLLGGGVVTVLSLYSLSYLTSFRKNVSLVLLKMPYLKKIILGASFARLFRSLHLLLEGGVPLLEALTFSRKMTKEPSLEELIIHTQSKIVEGRRMSELFGGSPLIPSLVVRMLAIAEETGNMTGTMQSLSEIYEEELDKDLAQLMTFLQPAVLLFLGVIVGLVVLAVLLPLTDVSSFLSS